MCGGDRGREREGEREQGDVEEKGKLDPLRVRLRRKATEVGFLSKDTACANTQP